MSAVSSDKDQRKEWKTSKPYYKIINIHLLTEKSSANKNLEKRSSTLDLPPHHFEGSGGKGTTEN